MLDMYGYIISHVRSISTWWNIKDSGNSPALGRRSQHVFVEIPLRSGPELCQIQFSDGSTHASWSQHVTTEGGMAKALSMAFQKTFGHSSLMKTLKTMQLSFCTNWIPRGHSCKEVTTKIIQEVYRSSFRQFLQGKTRSPLNVSHYLARFQRWTIYNLELSII